MLAGPALRRTTREDRRQPADDLALLGLGPAPLLVAEPQLLERTPRAVEPLPELFGGQVALQRLVADPAELGRLQLELAPENLRGPSGPLPPDQRETHQQSDQGCAVLLGSTAYAVSARGRQTTAPESASNACATAARRTTEIVTAKLIIEYNSTDDDIGVHGAFDRESKASIDTSGNMW